mmetsp:Transcript_21580/g.41172  ORF Transcript_21580/g.41172 Transcript_21580/m.41172 type:complete len:138 (-) Transcript_21580:338-751(-)|eukprot:CAMPEP_0114259570 /NCGR_PEP_ID=MMETSP0058-20121206/19966_1 /TAXON_ID=36894 /ORGANISM="Pyramimonas parkeae, CCMP726" /LENGTH=137 /DNA_ID=CAMNT_0001374631 /DNA_START=89 /DNA_END=502 /DNA_ORIENTATION=+
MISLQQIPRACLGSCSLRPSKKPAKRVLRPTPRSVVVRASFDAPDPLDDVRQKVKQQLGEVAKNIEDPILKQAVQEPVAFFGGMFAGLLRLEVDDDPLKEWIDRTAEKAGMTAEEAQASAMSSLDKQNSGPTEISID